MKLVKNRYFFTKNITDILNFSLSFRLFNEQKYNIKRSEINSIDLVLGRDHGQYKFRMVMKIICRNEQMNIIDEWIVKVVYIDCEKDTYKIL